MLFNVFKIDEFIKILSYSLLISEESQLLTIKISLHQHENFPCGEKWWIIALDCDLTLQVLVQFQIWHIMLHKGVKMT